MKSHKSSSDLPLRRARRELIMLRGDFPDDLNCSDYKSFLVHAGMLPHYPFREEVLLLLVELAYNCYTLEARYNKRLLFDCLRRYYIKYSGVFPFSEKHKQQMFELFCAETGKSEAIEKATSRLLSGQELNDSQVRKLIDLAFDSDYALERLLRYPVSNELISAWALYYYEDDRLRRRRLELTSWVVDTDPEFYPSGQILFDDQYHHYEREDSENFYFNYMYSGKLAPVLMAIQSAEFEASPYDIDMPVPGTDMGWQKLKMEYNQKNLDKRELNIFASQALRRSGYIINHRNNIEPLVLHRNRMMLWAVMYSHLETGEKLELIERYYQPELVWAVIYIAKKKQSPFLLEWLINKLNE